MRDRLIGTTGGMGGRGAILQESGFVRRVVMEREKERRNETDATISCRRRSVEINAFLR